MRARPGPTLARALVAAVLLLALVVGGAAWRRAAAAARQWQPVTLAAEGIRFRVPPDWRATPLGYADPAFDPKRPGAGLLLAVRSFAIPPEMRQAAPGERLERAALEAWLDAQRSGLSRGQRLLGERRFRIDGVRGALLLLEDRRDALPLLVAVGVAHEGRLYTFQVQAGPEAEPDDAARAVRRILRTVEWIDRGARASRALHE